MLQSERRSLLRFLLIYMGSTFLLFSMASWLFYTSTRHHLLDKQREVLKYESQKIESALRELHQSNSAILHYPVSKIGNSAIYDLDKHYIFGTFAHPPQLGARQKHTLSLISKIEPYYLGAAYLLLSKPIDYTPLLALQRNILFFMLLAGGFFAVLGYFLGKLFIAPMRESIKQMNHFIQDTTHELNTPISTILTNIEMIETFGECEQNKDELKRIEIASRTLSRIYDDLTYLNLNHQYHRRIIRLDMAQLIEERMVYFAVMAEVKHLRIKTDVKSGVILEMDRNDAIRLIDNLISNAIKYNKPEGELYVRLTEEYFMVKDGGFGIKKEDLKIIMHRFKRANTSEGGFGIGLDIVNQVVNSYSFVLQITSQLHQGTEVKIQWKK
ncbi:HAMP domain-containing sensor histidine kinase [Sulfurovum sp.]|uniref:sensor histidine kinase n=1 Tax=Sulfurovum sp. TaxID=1969726 RepID=UPI0025FF08A2|nr:HAMP domain-containing sensor histidine kinase [Sulfurovum sp.]